jgi:hypothetical protein
MKALKITIGALGVVAMLAVPATTMAAEPNGTFVNNDNAASNGSQIGQQSSQIKQNGQFVSGNTHVWDQTTTPGSRADLVQTALGH